MNEVNKIIEQAQVEQWPYPLVFDKLRDAGVINYEVTWKDGHYSFQYNLANATHPHPNPEEMGFIECSMSFSTALAKKAMTELQKGAMTYVEWVHAMAAAGITSYCVNMKDRTVTYYNHDRTESFVEQVPEL